MRGGGGGGGGRMEGCFSPVDDALKVIQRARLSYHPGAEQVHLRMRVLGWGGCSAVVIKHMER